MPHSTWDKGVHPELVKRIRGMVSCFRDLGFTLYPTDGLRTLEEQRSLYAQGRTRPGKIVTNANGVAKTEPGGTGTSNHQPLKDGWGHAVDCCFIVEGKASWDDDLPWELYGKLAKALGLRWGGDFLSLMDRPHVELP